MQEAFNGQRLTVAGRLAVAFAKLSAAAILAALVSTGSAARAAAETLRWKLNPGEVLLHDGIERDRDVQRTREGQKIDPDEHEHDEFELDDQ